MRLFSPAIAVGRLRSVCNRTIELMSGSYLPQCRRVCAMTQANRAPQLIDSVHQHLVSLDQK